MNRFFHLHENQDPKIQSAFRYANIILLATIATFLFETYLAVRTGAWQLWGEVGIILIVVVAMYISRQQLLAGKAERAAQFLIYSVMLVIVTTPFFIAGIGISLGLAGIILTMEFASRTTDRPERYVITSFVVAAITILLDLSLPDYRLTVPELQLVIPAVTGVVLVVLGFLAVRGFPDYSLRTKIIIVIVSVVMISIATIAFLTDRSLNSQLTGTIGNNMSALANAKASEIAQALERESDPLETLVLDQTVQDAIRNTRTGAPLSQASIEHLDSQWRTADANNNNQNWLVASVLVNPAASQLHDFQDTFPEHVEIFFTDMQGILLAATNRTSDYYQADEEWWQAASRDGLYVGQPEYDESTKTTAIIIAVVIQDSKTGNEIGILRSTIQLNALTNILASGQFGETGRTALYLPNHQEVVVNSDKNGNFAAIMKKTGFDLNDMSQIKDLYFGTTYQQVPVLAGQAFVTVAGEPDEGTIAISNLKWRAIVYQDRAEALQSVNNQTRNIVLLALVIFVIATFAALGLAQIISGPLIRLNAVAEKVAAGDLTAQAAIETGDETGTLAKTFNSMTVQLHDLIDTLEQRVADRTKALATSAEVSRYLSTILNERQLIVEVVEQLKAAFDYYHVHIYLMDEASGDLIMAGGSGDVGASMLGSGHKVPKGKGLVGRAAQTNVPVLVSDTSKDPAWLPNPLLPETKCEVAVPIATADKVLGVLDVQDDEVNGVKLEDFQLLQSLANQVAIALLNARSYVEVQQRADREARITSIGLKIKGTTSIEAALQTTARELGRTLGMNDIRVILEAPNVAKSNQKPD